MNPKKLSYSFFSFLITIKIWQLIIFIIALYFSAFFLFSNILSLNYHFSDIKLNGIILSSVFSVIAGMLINYFYDQEKDLIDQPIRSSIKKFVSIHYYLYLYLFFNAISLIIAGFLSFKIFIFFVVYQVLIWYYSHKLSKKLFVNNLMWATLTILPFFALTIHYNTINIKIIFLSLFLFLMLILKEIFKDINTQKTDILFNYKTLPLALGMKKTNLIIISILILLVSITLYLLIHFDFKWMNYYFIGSLVFFILLILYVLIKKNNYSPYIEMGIKIWILIGVFSIPDYTEIWQKLHSFIS